MDIMEAARNAKSAKELLALAKENNIDLDMQTAESYMSMLNKASTKLSDDELDNVAGGGCHTDDGRLVVSALNECQYWACSVCGGSYHIRYGYKSVDNVSDCGHETVQCGHCQYCTYERGLWLCNNPARRG